MVDLSFCDFFLVLCCRPQSIAQQISYSVILLTLIFFWLRRSLSVSFTLFKIRSNPKHPLSSALPLQYVPERVTRGANYSWCIGTRFRLLAVELLSTAGPSCSFQYCYGTILMTLFLIVWDWLVFRAEPMPSCWPNLFFYWLVFIFSPFHRFVLWGWGLRIDRTSVITLSQPCTADSLLIIIIIEASKLFEVNISLDNLSLVNQSITDTIPINHSNYSEISQMEIGPNLGRWSDFGQSKD